MAYAPPGSTTQSAGLSHLATVYYERRGLSRLTPMFRMYQAGEAHPLPQNSGKTIQMYRFSLPGTNTVPSSEGVIGTPIPQVSSTVSASVEQYSDFMSCSALLQETDINPTVDQMVDDLSYRAAASVDTIIRAEVDAQTSVITTSIGSNLAANDYKKVVALLRGINVQPKMGDKFLGIVHPYCVYDLITDNSAGGFIDALKYTAGQKVLDGEVGTIGDVRLLTSTNVGNDGVAAPNTKYYTYIFGKGGLGIVALDGRGPDYVEDPQSQKFKINVVKGGPNPADPEGQIGTFASYRFVFAAKTLDSTNYRFRIVKADSSII